MMRATVKRTFDAAIASLALLLLAPVFIVAAIAIRLESPGPVFFRQERIGRHGKRFRMIKFRTMVADAARLGPNVSGARDPRVTRVGAFLRRSFIDEAPQFLNVLAGDMSLVGPRPETPEYVHLFTLEERRILSVRPGMAGPSTVAYSRDEPAILAQQADPDGYYRTHLLHQRVAADLTYVDRWTLATDMRILAMTAAYVLSGVARKYRGAPPLTG